MLNIWSRSICVQRMGRRKLSQKREKARRARGSGKATECMVGANSLGRERSSNLLLGKSSLLLESLQWMKVLSEWSIIFFRFPLQKVNSFEQI